MFRVVQVGGILLAFLLSGCADDDKLTTQRVDASGAPRSQAAVSHVPFHESGREQTWPLDYQSKEYPGGAFAITDFGSPPPGDAAQVIRALEPLAKSGNSKASYEIFLKINECLDYLQSVQTSGSERPDLAATRKESATRCKNLSPDDYASASEWLSLSAEQGSLSAQLTYASLVEPVLGGASDYLRDPDAVKEYKERSHRYLSNAARKGSIDALMTLGDGYANGIMLERDFKTSYAYYLAVDKVAPNLVSKSSMAYLKSQLNTTQLHDAIQKGDQIYVECCKNSRK